MHGLSRQFVPCGCGCFAGSCDPEGIKTHLTQPCLVFSAPSNESCEQHIPLPCSVHRSRVGAGQQPTCCPCCCCCCSSLCSNNPAARPKLHLHCSCKEVEFDCLPVVLMRCSCCSMQMLILLASRRLRGGTAWLCTLLISRCCSMLPSPERSLMGCAGWCIVGLGGATWVPLKWRCAGGCAGNICGLVDRADRATLCQGVRERLVCWGLSLPHVQTGSVGVWLIGMCLARLSSRLLSCCCLCE